MNEVMLSGSAYLTSMVFVVLGLGVLLALLFPYYQNKSGRLGGGISFWKSIWLVYAIVLWLVLPWFFAQFDSWWYLLAGSMLVRGLIEAPLCKSKKWKVSYGVAHDVFHLLLVIPLFFLIEPEGIIWLWLTLVSLLVEILFVYCFRKTGGSPEEGIYFVPQGRKYRWVNLLTACLVMPQLVLIGGMIFKWINS